MAELLDHDRFRLTRENTEINSVVEDYCAQRGDGGFETTCHSTNQSAENIGRDRKKLTKAHDD